MTDTANARNQARAQFDSIAEMVKTYEKALKADDSNETEEALTRIQEDALSVEVRSGWYVPGSEHTETGPKPEEYTILLCTGGPAVRILGNLSEYGEPESARLQYQDWGTPWTNWSDSVEIEQTLLTYTQCFYFGE